MPGQAAYPAIEPFAFDDLLNPDEEKPSREQSDPIGAPEDVTAPKESLNEAYARGFAAGCEEGRKAGHAEGIEAGRISAMTSIAAADSETLHALTQSIQQWKSYALKAQAADRASLLALAESFLAQFCTQLAEERELDAATDLLNRLAYTDEKDGRINLFLPPRAYTQLSEKLDALLTMKGFAGGVTLQSDDALKQGECRLAWRGGSAERTHSEIKEAVRSLLEGPIFHQRPDETLIQPNSDQDDPGNPCPVVNNEGA